MRWYGVVSHESWHLVGRHPFCVVVPPKAILNPPLAGLGHKLLSRAGGLKVILTQSLSSKEPHVCRMASLVRCAFGVKNQIHIAIPLNPVSISDFR